MSAFRIEGKSRYIQMKISRSMFFSLTRDGDLRLRTVTCCRSTRISAPSRARDFKRERATSSSSIKNSTIGAPVSQANRLVTRVGFSVSTAELPRVASLKGATELAPNETNKDG